jgi:serine/threonine-protein kinase
VANDIENMTEESAQVRLLARNISTILYHGRLYESGREVVIKVWLVPPIMTPSQSQQAFTRFREEIQTLQQLKHPHILRPLNVRRTQQGFVVVSDYACRGSLQQLLQRNPRQPLSPERAFMIIRQIGEALQAAHQKGLVHGNLTPNNVVFLSIEGFDATDQIALTDFYQTSLAIGQAKLRENEHPNLRFYMAPEQFLYLRTPKTDLYGLACLAYELLTGNPPFVASARETLQEMHEKVIPPPPSAVNPALPTACDAAILKALAKQPDERYPDIQSFLAALQPCLQTARVTMPLIPEEEMAPLALEVEAISKATDDLVWHETSKHTAVRLADVNTPASGVVPAPKPTRLLSDSTQFVQPLIDPFAEPTQTVATLTGPLVEPTQAVPMPMSPLPPQPQKKSKRTVLLLVTAVLVVSLLGSVLYAFMLSGSSPNNQTVNPGSVGGKIGLTAATPAATYMALQASPTASVSATPTHQVATPTAKTHQSMLTMHPSSTPTARGTGSTVMSTGTVTPTLTCVQPQGLTSYLAKFGYVNSSATDVMIPVGTYNQMSSSSYNSQLPTNFVPGRQDAALQLHVPNFSSLTWTLDGSSVTANMFAKRC